MKKKKSYANFVLSLSKFCIKVFEFLCKKQNKTNILIGIDEIKYFENWKYALASWLKNIIFIILLHMYIVKKKTYYWTLRYFQ